MKTAELIQRLHEADPTGEVECCIGNADILAVELAPAYYDGCLQVLRRDPARAPYYDVVGAAYVGEGEKLVISEHSIRDAMMDHPDLPIEYIGASAQRYREVNTNERRAVHKGDGERADEHFQECVWKRCRIEGIFDELGRVNPTNHWEETRKTVREWFGLHGTPDEPLPPEFVAGLVKREWRGDAWYNVHPSHNDRYEQWWERVIDLSVDAGRLVIQRAEPHQRPNTPPQPAAAANPASGAAAARGEAAGDGAEGDGAAGSGRGGEVGE